MDIDWRLVLMAAGLAFVFEGLPYFLFAERMPSLLKMLAEQRPGSLRLLGLLAIFLGLGLLLMGRGL
ncbi:MAG: DUF2065 domain-containing protein [Desulfovibrio sp.]|nr:MAG: DUF2065 domain-containing protein [Desulfovibrio sp.]